MVSAHHPPPDPKARVTLRQQLSCGSPQRQKDKASSQCRSRAETSATWSWQRPALLGVYHLLGKPQDTRDGITGLALAGRQRVTVSSGQFFLPAAARCQECSQEAACCRSLPRNSLRAPLFLLTQPCCLQPVMGCWLLHSRPSVRKWSPLLSSPRGTRGPGPGPGGGVECGASQEDKRAFCGSGWVQGMSRGRIGRAGLC